MDKEKVKLLKDTIYKSRILDYVVKSDDVSKKELLEFLEARGIKFPFRFFL